jgi:hypothetical protein
MTRQHCRQHDSISTSCCDPPCRQKKLSDQVRQSELRKVTSPRGLHPGGSDLSWRNSPLSGGGSLSDVRVIMMIMCVLMVKSLCQAMMVWAPVLMWLLAGMCGCLWLRPIMPGYKYCSSWGPDSSGFIWYWKDTWSSFMGNLVWSFIPHNICQPTWLVLDHDYICKSFLRETTFAKAFYARFNTQPGWQM